MSPCLVTSLLIILTLNPTFVSARGGRGRGGGGGGGGGFDIGGGSGLSLEGYDAAIFAFNVLFAVVSFFQVLLALGNLRRRTSKIPPSISSPEFSTGLIFPVTLLVTTISLTVYDSMYAIYWGTTNNFNDPFDEVFSPAFFGAWDAFGIFIDTFLVAALLSLVLHREMVILNTSRIVIGIRRSADAMLVVILLALGMAYVGVSQVGLSELDVSLEPIIGNLNIAWNSFALVAAVYIAILSLILHIRSRRSPVNDHNITKHIAFIISPLLVLWETYGVIVINAGPPASDGTVVIQQWDLASVIIGGICLMVIIQTCLVLGLPPLPRQTGSKDQPLPVNRQGHQA